MIFVPLFIILLFTKPILEALGQDEKVTWYAAQYVFVSLPGVYFHGMFDLTKRFLNCMKTTWVPMIAQVCATFLHIYWCNLFVVQREWDIIGLGLASSITACILLTVTMVYAHLVEEI